MRRTGSSSLSAAAAAAAECTIPLPITYTPATHRVSKAKKGKRVHVCQYPDCNKIFTRAEHRRRHELNHNPDAWYRCSYPGCRRTFHRRDLLSRHIEKHELELQAEETARQWRLENQAENATTGGSSESLPPSTAAPDIVDRNADSPFLATASPIRTGPGSGSGSRSIVAPGLHSDLTKFNNDCCSTTTTTTTSSSTMWDHYGMEILPPLQCGPGMYTTIPEESASTVTADSPFYSPPETCASPLSSSDGAAAFELSPIRSSSVLPGPANAFIDRYPENILKSNSPLHASGFRWDWCDGGLYESNPVSVSLDGDVIQPTLQYQYPSSIWTTGSNSPFYNNENLLPPAARLFHSTTEWKSWTL